MRSRVDGIASGKLRATGFREIEGSNEVERIENAVKIIDTLAKHFNR
ncbi:MAG: hypothetical protein ABEJ99_00510 [Candidatus Nanohaloarchaea archaeon]